MKIKIALVDDHQLFLEGMKTLLSTYPTIEVVFVAINAIEALEKLKYSEIDLLITDISMPNMNGLEFIKIVKSMYPKLKIMVISMFDSIDSVYYVDGYLLKETPIEKMVQTIYGIVENNERIIEPKLDSSKSISFNKVILGKREKEIVQLIAQEYTTETIAEKLFISKATVETHRRNIFIKLQVNNIAGLIKKAMQLGIIK